MTDQHTELWDAIKYLGKRISQIDGIDNTEAVAPELVMRSALAEALVDEDTVLVLDDDDTFEPLKLITVPAHLKRAYEYLTMHSWSVEVVHTGGNVWVLQIQSQGALVYVPDYDGDIQTERPYVWITESETIDGQWMVGRYLHFGDEGMYVTVPLDALSATVNEMLVDLAEDITLPRTFRDAVHGVALDGRLEVLNTIGIDSSICQKLGYIELKVAEEGDGLRSYQHVPISIYMTEYATRQDDQKFWVYWSDMMVNDWLREFGSYEDALEYTARLIHAINMGITVDEIEPITLKRIVF